MQWMQRKPKLLSNFTVCAKRLGPMAFTLVTYLMIAGGLSICWGQTESDPLPLEPLNEESIRSLEADFDQADNNGDQEETSAEQEEETPPADATLSSAPLLLEEDRPPQEPPYPTTQNLPEPSASQAPIEYDENGQPIRRVPHPMAKKGLKRITKDGAYIYETELDKKSHSLGQGNAAFSFRFGQLTAPNITNTQDNLSFEDIYGSDTYLVLYLDYEKYLFSFGIGSLAWKTGLGISQARGTGRFKGSKAIAREKYDLYFFPVHLALTMDLKLSDHQPIIPYGEAGIDYLALMERRDDNEDTGFGGAPSSHIAFGAKVSLTSLTGYKAWRLYNDYGITEIWLMVEQRIYTGLDESLDFSANLWNFGFGAQF